MAAHKSESPAGTGLIAEDQTKTDSTDSASADAERKRAANTIALLALHHGHVVHRLADGGYLVVWRGLTRECRDLDELEAHARRVGAMQ